MTRAADSTAPRAITMEAALKLLPAGEVSTQREGRGYTFTETVPQSVAQRLLADAYSIGLVDQALIVRSAGDPLFITMKSPRSAALAG